MYFKSQLSLIKPVENLGEVPYLSYETVGCNSFADYDVRESGYTKLQAFEVMIMMLKSPANDNARQPSRDLPGPYSNPTGYFNINQPFK